MALLTVISRAARGGFTATLWVGRTLVTEAPEQDWPALADQLVEAGVLFPEALVAVVPDSGSQLRKLSLAVEEPGERGAELTRKRHQRR